MPTHRYEPDQNGITKLSKDDWAGWYEIVYRDKAGKPTAIARWWNGSQWNYYPNMLRGWKTLDSWTVLGINALVPR